MKAMNKIYPGLLCDSVEFFKEGNQLMFFSNGKLNSLHELSFMSIQAVKESIARNPDAQSELERMHPDSEMKQIEQFLKCNFSGLDFTPDIKDGVLQQGEYWDCPLRGCCSGEGKICKPLTYGGEIISAVEIKMMKYLVTEMTNETMADELFLPMGTFHLFKKNLYRKLNVSTKQEITILANRLNII